MCSKRIETFRDFVMTTLEELSLNALPALHTMIYDGWILRMSNGYSRRGNSVQPLYPPSQPLDQKIAFCENVYRRHNLPVIFKMTKACKPSDLEAELERVGILAKRPTSVQTCACSTPLNARTGSKVTISESWSDTWFREYCRLSRISPTQSPTMKQMLQADYAANGFRTVGGWRGCTRLWVSCKPGHTRRIFRYRGRQGCAAARLWHATDGAIDGVGKTQGAHRLSSIRCWAIRRTAQLYERLGFSRNSIRTWYRVRI